MPVGAIKAKFAYQSLYAEEELVKKTFVQKKVEKISRLIVP